MPEPKVIKLELWKIVLALERAAQFGELKKTMGDHIETTIDVELGMDFVKIGQDVVSHLDSLAVDHPLRRGVNLNRLKEGLDYLRTGTVPIVYYNGDFNKGDLVEVDYKK